MGYAEKQRLLFIQQMLDRDGFVLGKDLMAEFEIATAQVSRDFGKFKKLHPKAMEYNITTRRYEAKDEK